MKKINFMFGIFMLLASVSFAVTVTVNSTQPEVAGSNYQTIGAALTYIKALAEPRIVNITGGGPYSEATGIEIDYSVTIQGLSYKPLLICGPTATAGVNAANLGNGIYIFVLAAAPADTHIAVVLKNFILIPDKTNTPVNHGIRSNTDSAGLSTTATMDITIQDVVVTANNGSDQPVTTDGFTPSTAPAGIRSFGQGGTGRGVYLSGHINNLELSGVIVSWSYCDGCCITPDDYTGRTLYNANIIGPGCVFSYNGRNGIYVNSDGTPDTFNGTAEKPIWIYKNRAASIGFGNWQGALGIWHDDNARPEAIITMNYVNIVDNDEIGIHTGYTGSNASLSKLNASHCFICNNNGPAIFLSGELPDTSTTPNGLSEFLKDWTFTNCTIANNKHQSTAETGGRTITGPLSVADSAFAVPPTGKFIFNDCILAGKGSADSAGDNTINVQKDNLPALQFSYSGIVLSGPYTLGGTGFNLISGCPAPVQNNVINNNPEFVQTDNPFSSDYYGVNSYYYKGKGSGGTNLSGAGKFLYIPSLGVTSPWYIYQ